MIRARIDTHTIPPGLAGTRATLRHMRRLAREAALACSLLHRLALDIIERTETDAEAAQAVREWLAAHVSFEPDPPGRETVKHPSLMMREAVGYGWTRGDCDDVATLGAAIGHALGFTPRFVVLGFEPGPGFQHVFTYLPTSAGPVDLDVTAPAQFPPDLTVTHHAETDA